MSPRFVTQFTSCLGTLACMPQIDRRDASHSYERRKGTHRTMADGYNRHAGDDGTGGGPSMEHHKYSP